MPTPIGNMGDITDRARRVLEECDFVAAEDTRVGGKLLMLLGIKKPLVCFQEHTGKKESEHLVSRILEGETCALITDAGTPAVSDPGEKLVALAREMGVEVCALPGACAAICALSASGLPSRRFCFEGFLPDGAGERSERISQLKTEKRTFILYVSPHDAKKYLCELADAMPHRRCVLAKELTKVHEKYFCATLRQVYEQFCALSESQQRGEYVLICEGLPKEDAFWESMTVEQHVEHYISMGLSKMDACKQTARDRGVGKGVIYDLLNKSGK